MKRSMLAPVLTFLVAMPSPTVWAADAAPRATAEEGRPAPRIDHQPVACVLGGSHPRLEARLEGASEGLRIEAQFKADTGTTWYAVVMRRDGLRWTGRLPRPLRNTHRISYALVARDATGAERARVPEVSAFLVDVVAEPCVDDLRTAATEPGASITLVLPEGASRVPTGFEAGGIAALVKKQPVPTSTAEGPRPLTYTAAAVSLGSRVRVKTAKGVHTGTLSGTDSDGMFVTTGGKNLRVIRERIKSVEVYQGGSGAMKVVGGLAGLAGGLALSLLYYVTVDGASSSAPLVVLTVAGGVLGAAATPGERWQKVNVWADGLRVSLVPVPGGGAGAQVTLGF